MLSIKYLAKEMANHWIWVVLVFILVQLLLVTFAKKNIKEKPDWAKKDIRDFSDADMERLLDQWEEDEEPLEPDELPEHLRPQPTIDFNKLKLDGSNPEDMLKMTKKGRTLMMFVTVAGEPSREETDQLTKLWQGSLWNNHIQAERYLIEDNRAIFMFKDGAMAWDAKDFLVQQKECKEVSVENKVYPGNHMKSTDTKDNTTPPIDKVNLERKRLLDDEL